MPPVLLVIFLNDYLWLKRAFLYIYISEMLSGLYCPLLLGKVDENLCKGLPR